MSSLTLIGALLLRSFFRGSFDKKVYLDFCEEAFTKLQEQRLEADTNRKAFKVKTE
jgi:hypothetical protein